MKKYSFTKMNGAGNDFVMLDAERNPGLELTPALIRELADRKFGIGADGVIRVSRKAGVDFLMEYFNADGSGGMLCGNGARCAVRFAYMAGMLAGDSAVFENNGHVYRGDVLPDNRITFHAGQVRQIKTDFKVKAAGQMITAHFADNGARHVVIFAEDILRDPAHPRNGSLTLDEVAVHAIGREIRSAREFDPPGTNVNFISVNDGKIFMRTYERGVEAETLACGTGAIASAAIVSLLKSLMPPFEIVTRSGKMLTVDFRIEDREISDVSLTGPAEINFYGEFEIHN